MLKKETLQFISENNIQIDNASDEHQLINENMIKLLVNSLQIQTTDNLLEIGPGAGNITVELAATGAHIIAIEKNPKWLSILKKRLYNYGNVEILQGDILKYYVPPFDAAISNLPFSISEAFLQRLTHLKFKSASLIVPKTIGETLVAHEGESYYSKLSLISRLFFNSRIIAEIPSEAYFPQPNTTTCILKIDSKPPEDVVEAVLGNILKQNDKKLGNALREALIQCSKQYEVPSTKKSATTRSKIILGELNPESRTGRLSLIDLIKLRSKLSLFLSV
jgi:16S rRNA (adenine1518-N6/adenine1519-N6)-dimethyltransferase